VLFVSCDDNEVANLRALLNEVFGEENFVTTVIWQKVYAPKNSARHFSEDHDYILVYARRAESWRPRLLPRTADQDSHYTNPDNDLRGAWRADGMSARNYYSKGNYAITCPSGRVIEGPPRGRYWIYSEETFKKLNADGRIWWGLDGNNNPAVKRFLSDVKQGRVPQTLWTYSEVGHTQDAKKDLLEHVAFADTDNVLDTVKPTSLIRRMLQVATEPGDSDIVLDFFGGSGPTGQAVLEQNRDDEGNRRFILVQIPEPLPKPEPGLKNITDIANERLRSASKTIENENREWKGDTGFRAFKLNSSNIRAWEPNLEDIEKTLLDNVEHIKEGRSEEDLLYELLLKLGLDLCVPIENRTIADKTVYSIGAGTLIACLDEAIPTVTVEPLALGIADWHKKLDPLGESTIVFRDSAFPNDVAKTNLTAILQQHGLENVRSL
jgi:adenine-specific DNA-methyltransferase